MTNTQSSSPLTDRHVLVVEDDPMMAELVASMVRRAGASVAVAPTAMDALDEISSNNPHAVILDLNLPDLDGIELLQAFRGHSTVPIVVLTGRSQPHFRIEAILAGASAFLLKPVSSQVLIDHIMYALATPYDQIHAELQAQLSSERDGAISAVSDSASTAVERVQEPTDGRVSKVTASTGSYGRFITDLEPVLQDADAFVREFVQRGGE